MPRLPNAGKVNWNSFDPAENRSLSPEVPPIHEADNGIQFFDGKCTVHVANQLELRQEAYKLLYDIYLKSGLAKKNNSGLWLSIYDALPDTTTLAAEDEKGKIVGALTLVFDSPIGLPSDNLYKAEIDELRHAKQQICEIVSFSISSKAKSSIKVLAGLFYCSYLFALRIKKSTDFIITVNPCYNKLYCQKLLFNKIGPEKTYAKVNGAPAVLLNLSLELPGILKHKQRIFPLYMLDYSEQEELNIAEKIQDMHRSMSDEEFYTFFIEKTNVWELASHQQKEFIKKVYPADKVNHNRVSRALARAFSKKIRSSEAPQKSSAKLSQK
jgi:hypothetical protein